MRRQSAGIIVILILLSASFVLGRLLAPKVNDISSDDSTSYPLLAKRIFIENPNEPIVNFTELRQTLREYYADNKLSGSLYFEYLPTGTSIRINDDNEEVAASLAKLPVAMVLYKTAELGKINLDTEISLKQEWLDDGFGTLYQQGVGYKLSLRHAAELMLSDSDNTALAAITASIDGLVEEDENPFAFLDVAYTQNPDMTLSIGARSYSSFLKCLYFSCYLDKDGSEEILSSLSNSTSNTRLKAGVPNNIVVAHKIGTFSNTTQSDCGIIYLEKKNYLLCAMIDGPDNNASDQHLAKLSQLTYNFVNNTSAQSR